MIKRTEAEIAEQMHKAADLVDTGLDREYARGVEDALRWVLGGTDERPMDSDDDEDDG